MPNYIELIDIIVNMDNVEYIKKQGNTLSLIFKSSDTQFIYREEDVNKIMEYVNNPIK
jgi:hypothetical protein